MLVNLDALGMPDSVPHVTLFLANENDGGALAAVS